MRRGPLRIAARARATPFLKRAGAILARSTPPVASGNRQPLVHDAVKQAVQPAGDPWDKNLHDLGREPLDLVLAVRRASDVSQCGRKAHSREIPLVDHYQIAQELLGVGCPSPDYVSMFSKPVFSRAASASAPRPRLSMRRIDKASDQCRNLVCSSVKCDQ